MRLLPPTCHALTQVALEIQQVSCSCLHCILLIHTNDSGSASPGVAVALNMPAGTHLAQHYTKKTTNLFIQLSSPRHFDTGAAKVQGKCLGTGCTAESTPCYSIRRACFHTTGARVNNCSQRQHDNSGQCHHSYTHRVLPTQALGRWEHRKSLGGYFNCKVQAQARLVSMCQQPVPACQQWGNHPSLKYP